MERSKVISILAPVMILLSIAVLIFNFIFWKNDAPSILITLQILAIVFVIVDLVAYYGIWLMKQWGVMLLGVSVLLSFGVNFFGPKIVSFSEVIPFIILIIFITQYKRMSPIVKRKNH